MSSFTHSFGSQSVTFNDAIQASTAALRDSNGDLLTNVFYGAIGLKTDGYIKAGVIGGSTGSAANVGINETTFNGFLFTLNNLAASRTATFEAAATVPGKLIAVKKLDSSAAFTGHGKFNGAETGDGANTFDLYDQYETKLWMSDATGWQLVGEVKPEPLQRIIADPGNAGAIPITRSGRCAITSTGADTRTLAAPTFVGQQLLLIHAVDGGSVAVTVSAAFDLSAHTILTATAVAASCLLIGTLTGSTKKWTLAYTDGFTAS